MLTGMPTSFADFSAIQVGKRIAQGGAGTIFSLSSHPDFVLKKYHQDSDLKYYEQKVANMLGNPPVIDPASILEFTWPLCSVKEKGDFVGYVMPSLGDKSYFTLSKFINKKARQVNGLSEFLGHRITLAHNLSAILSKIHKLGYLVVDLKPQNCLVEKQSLKVTLIDTDGFFVPASGGVHFPAKQFTPEFIAPELCNKSPSDADIMQDNFALAVMIFQLLNNGIHPFQASMKTKQLTIQEMIERQKFAYGRVKSSRLIASKYSIHEWFPDDIRELFDQAFASKVRPSSQDWRDCLRNYTAFKEGVVSKCSNNSDHLVLAGRCGQCELEARQSRQIQSTLRTSSSKLRSNYSSKARVNLTTNKKISNVAAPAVIKRIKTKLLARSMGNAVVTHFAASIVVTSFNMGVDFFDYIEMKSESVLSSSIYIFILFVFFYKWNRGEPARDCPSCGAYAGSLRFLSKVESPFGYRYQTKSGRADKRYKHNPMLYIQTSDWKCIYCDNAVQFTHVPHPSPSKKTPISSKRVI
jgi:serine/threonine protein kinase